MTQKKKQPLAWTKWLSLARAEAKTVYGLTRVSYKVWQRYYRGADTPQNAACLVFNKGAGSTVLKACIGSPPMVIDKKMPRNLTDTQEQLLFALIEHRGLIPGTQARAGTLEAIIRRGYAVHDRRARMQSDESPSKVFITAAGRDYLQIHKIRDWSDSRRK